MSDNFGLFCTLYPYIQDTVVEASETDMMRSIQMAMREFFVDTEIFSEDYVVDTVVGQTTYVLESIYSAKNYRVITIELDGAAMANNQYSVSTSGRVITLVNAPTDATVGGLEIKTAIKPNLTCEQLDEDQVELWYEAIIALTKSKLHAQPRKPWSDPLEASYQLQVYEGYIELVSSDRVTVGQSGSTNVNFGAYA